MPQYPTRTVAHVVFDGFTTLDMYGPVQAFASCRTPDGNGGWHRFFDQITIGVDGQAGQNAKAGEGPSTAMDFGYDNAPDFDILLIPGGFGTRAVVTNELYISRVDALCERASIIATVCTGSVVLAATGRLDGRPATSNKVAWDWVTSQAPDVLWQRQARWVDDGDIITSSGVSAGIDMSLSVIARELDREVAETSARFMEYIWHDDPDNDPFA